MRNPSHLVVVALLLLVTSASAGAPPARSDRPTNIIVMIADGCGPSSVGLGRMVAGQPLALDGIEVGTCRTGSASSRITDSAAAATALACGIKTANGTIGQDTTGRALVTLLERARERGMATGLVVKSTISDATPAAFAAHVRNRSSQDTIAVQEIEHGVDVLMGGGREWFLPASRGGSRHDSVDVIALARSRGYAYAATREELAAARRAPLLGLFAGDDMSYALDREVTGEPSLPEMADRALQLLAGRKAGFFVMIEGSLVDHAGHANDPATHARELLEYDATVRAVLDFARRDGHTLVVSTADHETGGLALGRRLGERSYYELRIETLRQVSASTSRMADSIAAGAAPENVAARYTGAPLTEEERAILLPAVAARKGVAAALGEIESRRALVGWTTGGHTAADVGLYAFGPGSARFRGVLENTEVARRLAELMGVRLSPESIAGTAGR